MKRNTPAPNQGGTIYTLAQTGTANTSNGYEKPATIITGQGSALGDDKVLKGRGKRKMISQKMALNLVDVAKQKESPERQKGFWNTYHCQNRIYTYEGRYYGKYCKNRHCLLCCSIRKADIINRYYPVMKQWQDAHFVTLTVKSVSKDRLRIVMKKIIQGFNRITGKCRKRNQRGKGIRLIGAKSLECNFNAVTKKYNPHLHLIVASKEIAQTLVNEWLSLWTPGWATRRAQFIRPVENLERDLIETIKYGSKIFTEPDVSKKSAAKTDRTIYAAALYNIFEAMKGLRIFDRFGFDLPPGTKRQPTAARVIKEYYEWVFLPEYHDWQNVDNELVLTAYEPPRELVNLLEESIDRNEE